MDKKGPNGEHNIVEWARLHVGERRFYLLMDPRLEGHFSIKGTQKKISRFYLLMDPRPEGHFSIKGAQKKISLSLSRH